MNKLILAISTFLLLATPALAETSTLSATPATDLQNKIKSIVQENLTATEKVLERQVIQKYTGRTGTIKSVGAKNLTLEVDKDVIQVSLSTIDIKSSTLVIGNKIIVLGILTTDNVLEAKKILPYVETKPEDLVISEAIVAKIKTIDQKKKTLILNIDNQDQNYTLSKKNNINLEDFADGQTIFGISKKYLGKLSLSRAQKL